MRVDKTYMNEMLNLVKENKDLNFQLWEVQKDIASLLMNNLFSISKDDLEELYNKHFMEGNNEIEKSKSNGNQPKGKEGSLGER